MAILLDFPRWPAHGTLFSHLISDKSLIELFTFADDQGLPVGAFDHDHYDVPAARYPDLLAAGAQAVSGTELVRRLVGSGLRMRAPQRTPKAAAVLPALRSAWQRLLPDATTLGEALLDRWQEPHRHYHDVRHLAQLLTALTELAQPVSRPVLLAAWFHDAIYTGEPGADEDASAQLARESLPEVGVPISEVQEVARLIQLTCDHRPDPDDQSGAQLVDADLSVLGQPPGRYHFYARSVRLEHPGVSMIDFAQGRHNVLKSLLASPTVYTTEVGRQLWEERARKNTSVELARWSRFTAISG